MFTVYELISNCRVFISLHTSFSKYFTILILIFPIDTSKNSPFH